MRKQLFISIEIIPDIASLRDVNQLEGLSDEGVLSASLHLHKQQFSNASLPLYQQQIVSISLVKCLGADKIEVDCPTEMNDEVELIQWFVDSLNGQYSLVSWDMDRIKSLLMYRMLKHGIVSECFNKLDTTSLKALLFNGVDNDGVDLSELSLGLGLPSVSSLTQTAVTDCYLKQQLAPVHQTNRLKVLNVCHIFQKFQMINAMVLPLEFKKISDALNLERQ